MKRQPEQAEVSVKSKRKSPTKKQGQFNSTKIKKILSFRDVHYTCVFYLIRNFCCLGYIVQVNISITKSNVNVFLGQLAQKLKPSEARPRFCHLCDKQFYFEEPFQIHLKNVHKDGAQTGKKKKLKILFFAVHFEP
jgi:hypothetical protein